LHDLSFIEERASEARYYWALAIAGVTIGLGILGALLGSGLVKRWRNLVRESIKDARSGSPVVLSNEASTLLGPELRTVLRELRAGQSAPASIHVEWSREVLHNVLNKELPDTDVIVASNREPYIHNRVGDDVVLQIPASGLVAALEPVMRACGGTWVAHGSGSADRDSVDAHDRVEKILHCRTMMRVEGDVARDVARARKRAERDVDAREEMLIEAPRLRLRPRGRHRSLAQEGRRLHVTSVASQPGKLRILSQKEDRASPLIERALELDGNASRGGRRRR